MEYIKELKDWIDVNVKSFGVKRYEDFFTKKTGYCPSKWKSDFKEFVGMTLRDYLIKEKMKICWDYKMRKQDCSIAELMAMVNYDLTTRSFSSHMRNYEEKYLKKNIGHDTDVCLFHNTAVFSEILVRSILFLDLAKPEVEDNFFLVEHNVENTVYQIDNISSTETAHCYKVFLSLDDLSLSFMGPWVKNSLDDERMARFYNSMSIYAYYLERIDKLFLAQTGFSFTKCIKKWNDFLIHNSGVFSFILQNTLNRDINQNSAIRLEINRKSNFISATDAAIDNIKEIMLDRCKGRILDLYGVTYDTMLNYVRAVNKLSYLKMKRVLETVDTLNDPKVIKLFFELTRCPHLDGFLLTSWKSDLEDAFVCKLSQHAKADIINFLIDFKKEFEKYAGDVFYEEEIYDWCLKVMKEW